MQFSSKSTVTEFKAIFAEVISSSTLLCLFSEESTWRLFHINVIPITGRTLGNLNS